MEYYYLDATHQQVGPLSLEQLQESDITPDTQVWHDGMEAWQPARELPELAAKLSVPQAPVPATAVPAAPAVKAPKVAAATPQPVKKKSHIGLFIGLGVGALLLILAIAGVLVWLFFFNFNKYPENVADAIDTTQVIEPEKEIFFSKLDTETKEAKTYFMANEVTEHDDGTFYLTKSYEIEWPTQGNFDIVPLQEEIARVMFDKRTTSITDAAAKWLNSGQFNEMNFTKISQSNYPSEIDFGHEMSEIQTCHRITENMPLNVVGFATGGDTYLGGAHGMPFSSGIINFDCEQGHAISYGDIFKPDCDSKILSMLKKERKNSSDYDSSFGLPERIPKNDMTLLASGIKFAYSVYEIGCYAEGFVEIKLSYNQIQPYLTDYGKELFDR
ncbi:GYF domain-containing protein [Sodaliphilus sp.]|uniref:GYF domain-containing protein n=1 Tax=Sodaliphilus sp. TaxID=2815818 RepID=UPI00388F7FDD